MTKIAILGGGGWGTALAIVLSRSRKLHEISLWVHNAGLAAEAARGEPTAVVLASRDAALAAELQEEFAGPAFRLYTNDDVLGVELAGAMKNVMAIAAGACHGVGLGAKDRKSV